MQNKTPTNKRFIFWCFIFCVSQLLGFAFLLRLVLQLVGVHFDPIMI